MKITRPAEGRFEELMADPHVNEAADRVFEALKGTTGSLNCPSRDSVLRDVANAVAILEANPTQRMIYGLCLVTAGPMDGWRVYVPAADVFSMRLESFFERTKD